MATHSSTLAWEIPWTEEPGRLYSPCSRKESDITRRAHTCMHTLHTIDINPSWDIHVWKHSHSKACLLPLFKVYFLVCVCVSVCVCACMHVQLLSHVWLFATLWTVARQVLLSMGFSGQECWSGLPFLTPVDLPDPRDGTHVTCISLTFSSGFFTTYPPGKPYFLTHAFKFF